MSIRSMLSKTITVINIYIYIHNIYVTFVNILFTSKNSSNLRVEPHRNFVPYSIFLFFSIVDLSDKKICFLATISYI